MASTGSTVKYDLRKFKNARLTDGTRLEAFAIRETDGKDEEYAAQRAKAKGGTITVTEELIRASVVEVNGQPVEQPYEALDGWNSRARGFLIAAWRTLNTVDDKEIEDFLGAAVDGR